MRIGFTLLAIVLAIVSLAGLSPRAYAGRHDGPAISTDKSDYAPGEIAQITGTGWYPNQSVTLQVVHTDGTAEGGAGHEPWVVTSDDQGNVSATWLVDPDDSLGSSFLLTANCQPAGMDAQSAQALFTDKSSTTTVVVSSVNPSVYGQSVTFTATVTGAASATPTGSITFSDGNNNPIGSGVLSGSGNHASATFTTTLLTGGVHTIIADFNGDANYTKSSGTVSQTVNAIASTVVLTSSPNPANQTANVTFTATVSGAGPNGPSGTVTFKEGATTLGSGTISAGVVTFQTSSLAIGSHNITAVYGGDSNYNPSTSNSVTQVINARTGTTTALASSSNPANQGVSVTFTATVSPVSGGGTPTGTVTFKDGATTLGTSTLSGGAATFSSSSLSIGTHAITATYNGDTNFAPSTSGSVNQLIKGNTTTTVVSSLNPSVFSQNVTFTVTVNASSGQPSGSVTLLDGASTLATLTLNSSSQATFSTSGLAVGTHSITASYAGDSTYNSSNATALNQVVNKISTSTALASSLNPSWGGQSVTLTATVTISGPGSGSPSGTVTFTDGAITLGTSSVSGGSAAFTTSSLAPGSHNVTASYSGDTNFASSNGSVSQTVNDPATSVVVTSSNNPSTYGQSVSLTAHVMDASGTKLSTGSVTFMDGATVLVANMAINNGGNSTFTTTILTAGSHAITATYNSDGNHNSSVGSLTETVNKATATVTLSNLTQTYDGSPKSATITTNPAGVLVNVTYGANSTPPTDAGSYAVVATVTDPNYTGSASGTLVINKASATLSLSNLNQTYDGSQKPATVTVSPSGLSGVNVTYNGLAAVPTNAGSYSVVASLNNPNYQATDATGTLQIAKASASLTITGTSAVYDASPHSVVVTVSPTGLSGVSVTYDGSATAPTNAGSYAVVASLNNPNYQASNATATLQIAKADQTITFAQPADMHFGDPDVDLGATASSGLAVQYAVTDPAVLTGASLSVPANGDSSMTITVTASQPGDTNHNAATDVVRVFNLFENMPATSTASASPAPNGAGWNRSDVTVQISAVDNPGGDGVKEIHYQVNGGADMVASSDSTSLVVGTEGSNTVTFWSVDKAGNVEAPQSLTILLDKTAPDIQATPDRAPDSNGWYTHPVTFTFNASDGGSGVDSNSVSQPVQYSSPDSKSAFVAADASDIAGNSTHKQFSFKYDATAPVIVVSGLGEHCHQSVTFGVSATDGGSGATLTMHVVLLKNGSSVYDQTFTDVLPVMPDMTLAGAANDGMYELDVTTTDEAGNVSTKVVPFEINNQAPIITFLPGSPQDHVYYNAPQTIQYSVTTPAPPLTIIQQLTSLIVGADLGPVDLASGLNVAAEGQYKVHIDATDCGGLESVSDLTFFIDMTAPDVADAALSGDLAPNPAWYKSNVGVTITASDPKLRSTPSSPSNIDGSGVKDIRYYMTGAQPAGDANNPVVVAGNSVSFTINTEGITTITYWATDNAGNASAPKVLVVRYDKTAPDFPQPSDVTVVATQSDGAIVSFDTPAATDNVDNAPTVTATPTSGSLFGVGDTMVTVTAVDAAGNQTVKTFTVTVNNPVPVINTLTPATKTFGDGAFTMTIDGDKFMPDTVVRFDGQDRVTHFVSFTQVQVDVPASDMAAAGSKQVTAFTPTPGGGSSNAQTFTIDKAHQTISFDPLGNKTYGDAPFSVVASASSGLDVTFSVISGPATIAGNLVTITGAGSVTIRAAQGGNDNWYAADNVDRTFTVQKATPVVSVTGGTFTYDGNPHPATGSVTGVGGASLGSPTITYSPGGSNAPVDAGTYGVSADFAGNNNYNSASASTSILINKADQTITFGALANKTYGDAAFALAASASSGLDVNFSIVSGPATTSGNMLTITGAGTVKVKASQAGNNNYNAAPDVCQSFTVAKFTPTVGVTGGTFVYDGNPHPATGSVTGANNENLGAPTFSYNTQDTNAPVNAGTYTATGSFAGNDNYNPASAQAQIVINKAPASISLSNLSQTYNGSPRSVTATTSPSGLAGVSITYDSAPTAPINAGSYAIVASLDNPNYSASDASGTLVVAKADPTVSATGGTYTYDGNAHPATGNVTGVNSEALGSPTFNYTPGGSSAPVNAGSYSAVGSFAGNANYNPATASAATIVINKADQTISFGSIANHTFGDAAFALSANASSNLGVSFAVVSGPATINGNMLTITGAGSVTVRASQAGNGNFNAAPNVDQSFTVNKADVTISITGGTFTYDNLPHAATGSITGVNNQSLVSPTFSYSPGGSNPPVNAGTYTVTASFAGDANYNAATSGATIIINKATLVATAANKSKLLNAPNPALTGSLTGVQAGDNITVTYSTTATQSSDVGSYPITPTLVDPNGRLANYNVTINPGTLTIGYKNNSGILQPINADGSSVSKQGSTIPAKFQVFDVNGASIGTPGVVASFRLVQIISGTVSTTVNETVDSTTPDTTFRWDPTGQLWIFNINTKNLSKNNTYVYLITLKDGSTISFQFGLR